MRRLSLVAVVTLAACGPSTKPAPTPPASTTSALDAARLDAQLTPYIQAFGKHLGEVRAMSGFVLVAQRDRPVYARAFGYADREHQRPADADTSFRVGSVTKQFTAAAILVLQQDGKLSVDDPISKHLPEYPAVGAALTLHQLLTHTSGLPNYTDLPTFAARVDQPTTVDELLKMFWDQPLEFTPGSRYEYSNSNYIVLGAIVEKASGMSYADFCAKRLFAPAGMTRTVVGDADGAPDRALGYEPDGEGLALAPPIDMSTPFAAGAVRSTANDLVRWSRALDGDAILTAASKARLYKVEQGDYAYGWIVKEHGGHRVIAHNGEINGFTTIYARIPDLDVVIVGWSNNTGMRVDPVGEAAMTVALGGAVTPIEEPTPQALDEAAAARTVGSYTLTPASRAAAAAQGVPDDVLASVSTMELTRDGDHLVLTPNGQGPVTLTAAGPDRYMQVDLQLGVAIALPAAGHATGMTITQGGLTLEYTRISSRDPSPAR